MDCSCISGEFITLKKKGARGSANILLLVREMSEVWPGAESKSETPRAFVSEWLRQTRQKAKHDAIRFERSAVVFFAALIVIPFVVCSQPLRLMTRLEASAALLLVTAALHRTALVLMAKPRRTRAARPLDDKFFRTSELPLRVGEEVLLW